MLFQAKFVNRSFSQLVPNAIGDTFDLCVVSQVLLDRHLFKDKIRLRAVSDELPCFLEVSLHVVAIDANHTLGRFDFTC